MKIILIILTILALHQAHGFSRRDTIAHWQIYYGDQLVTAGHELNARTPEIGIVATNGQIQKLKIVYNYDAVKPKWRTIQIKNGTSTLYHETQQLKDNHPALIDLSEALKNRKGTFEIQIYYTDDITTKKNRLIGKIKIKIG